MNNEQANRVLDIYYYIGMTEKNKNRKRHNQSVQQ
jgi:hypothetical protein